MKKTTLWNTIVSYNIHLLFLLALLLVIIRQPLLQVVCSFPSIDAGSRFYFPIEFLINVCITVFWSYIACRTVFDTRYTVDDDGNIIYRVLVYANGKYILGETTPVMGDSFKG